MDWGYVAAFLIGLVVGQLAMVLVIGIVGINREVPCAKSE